MQSVMQKWFIIYLYKMKTFYYKKENCKGKKRESETSSIKKFNYTL